MKHPRSLSSRRDFRRVMHTGARKRSSFGTFYVVRAVEDNAVSSLGLAVPRRVGGAVTRNRIKRRLREAYRAGAPERGFDVVIQARPEAAHVDFQQLAEEVSRLVAAQ